MNARIIIPTTKDRSRYLERTLNECRDKKVATPITVVCRDSGKELNPVKSMIAAQFPEVEYVAVKCDGNNPLTQLNHGAKTAIEDNGDSDVVLLFMHDECFPKDENAVANLIASAKDHGCCYAKLEHFDPRQGRNIAYNTFRQNESRVGGQTMAILGSLFKKVGGFDYKLRFHLTGEWRDLFTMIGREGGTFWYEESAHFYHQSSPAMPNLQWQISQSDRLTKLKFGSIPQPRPVNYVDPNPKPAVKQW